MGAFFAAMRDEIEAEGGTVEKFIGDAVMAAFGVPQVHEDDPARALRAALRMRTRLDELNDELARALRRRARAADRDQHRLGDGGHRPAAGRGARDRRRRQRGRAARAGRRARAGARRPSARRRPRATSASASRASSSCAARPSRCARVELRHRAADHRGHAVGHARAARRPRPRARAADDDLPPRRSRRGGRTSSRSTARRASARAAWSRELLASARGRGAGTPGRARPLPRLRRRHQLLAARRDAEDVRRSPATTSRPTTRARAGIERGRGRRCQRPAPTRRTSLRLS